MTGRIWPLYPPFCGRFRGFGHPCPPLARRLRDLESRSEPERLRRVSDLLDRAAAGLKLKQEIGERAATNGKVVPPPQVG